MNYKLYCAPEERYENNLFTMAWDFRKIALDIDNTPTKIRHYLGLPAIDFLISDRDSNVLTRTSYLEAFSYGDPGVLLACPGPSLSGLMLRELGSEVQIENFYHDIKVKKMRTFFALTEPTKGSDANNIETKLLKSGKKYFLTGEKAFFGNGAVAETGVVLARINEGPIGIRAVLLTPDNLSSPNIESVSLPMMGLRGAQIAYMRIRDLEIHKENILGSQKSACENGLMGILNVFNKLRTGVGALALGQAQGVYDTIFLQMNGKNKSIFHALNTKLTSARRYLYHAAHSVDNNASDFYVVSSAKIIAVRTAQTVIKTCFDMCSWDELIANPWVMKAYRDVFCWEFMEGTTAIQKLQMRSKLRSMFDEAIPFSFTT